MRKRSMLSLALLLSANITMANQLTIIKPTAVGNVDSYFPLERAFDAQIHWDGVSPVTTSSGSDAPAYGSRLGYIDFGPDYRHYRIVQSWTQYRPWSGGTQVGFAQMWWDNDNDAYNDGLAETQIRFNAAANLPHQGSELWQADMQLSVEQAIVPPGRYLMLKSDANITNRAKEYALVGWFDDYAPPPPPLGAQTPHLLMDNKPGFDYSQLTLVDEITFAKTSQHAFAESAPGVSQIETIYGQSCRTLPNNNDDAKYFAYKLATGNKLQAGKGYVLVVDYPEDKARSVIVSNHGAEINRGFHTGITTGDALFAPYEKPTNESLHYGLSNKVRSWEQLFHLHDRFPALGAKPKTSGVRTEKPKDGFWVAISQFGHDDAPQSAGAAVCRIALYEAPKLSQYAQTLNLPPDNLPQRQLFFREEMGDGVITDQNAEQRGLDDPIDWYENRAKMMKFLGMNTYSQDLLEFGHNQGWDSGPFTEKDENWYVLSQYPHRWEKTIERLMRKNYGFNLLPYYEYAGSTGADGVGILQRSEPLYRTDGKYTAAGWSEKFNIDVSDPAALEDAKRLLDATLINQFKGHRPVPKDVGSSRGLDNGWQLGWGYIDFGPQYADINIRQGWTRSRRWHGGNATPYAQAYWYNGNITEFDPSAQVAQNAETNINFITQKQSNTSYAWSKDFDFSAENAVTPKGRYLVLKADDNFTDIYELLLLGSTQSTPEQVKPLQLTGGMINGSKHDMSLLFDNQPGFNDAEPMKVSGIWLRPRLSAMPYGFGATTLARFATILPERNGVSKEDLTADPALLTQYYQWWNEQRQQFLNRLRDYVKANTNPDAVVLFTADTNECGASHPTENTRVISDEMSVWNNAALPVLPFEQALEQDFHLTAQTQPYKTWGGYEYQHSVPRPDVTNYQDNQGVLMTYTFGNQYTVDKASSLEAFKTQSGLAAIRHYCLNEDAMSTSDTPHLLGYFVTDMELAGPYITLPEAKALANGDPYYFGYLSSNNFNRGFPGYVRDFNANYLALPALPSNRDDSLADKDNIAVRVIDTPNSGKYIAVINTGLSEITNVQVTITVAQDAQVTFAANGQAANVANGKLSLDLHPGQLVSLHIH